MSSSDLNHVTVEGSLCEMPTRSETATGIPTARFWISSLRQYRSAGEARGEHTPVEVFCVGHPANSICRYGRAGVRVMVHGRLSSLQCSDPVAGDQCRWFVLAESLSYPSPRTCAGLAEEQQ